MTGRSKGRLTILPGTIGSRGACLASEAALHEARSTILDALDANAARIRPQMKRIAADAQATREVAAGFVANLPEGGVVALTGDLGSGRTEFVKGLVAGLGSSAQVTSPTFTLIH